MQCKYLKNSNNRLKNKLLLM